jgi:glutaredoxin
MIVKAIREGLGHLFVFGDYLTRPKTIERSDADQAVVDKAVKQMSLYQFYACPFCIKTRRAIRRLNLPMEYRNAQAAGQFRNDLENLGGKIKVPCLRFEEDGKDRWLYESDNIIAYLKRRFGATA